jgi:hypothetical protein
MAEEIVTLQDALVLVGGLIALAIDKLKANPVEAMYVLMLLSSPIMEEWFENTGMTPESMDASASRIVEEYGSTAIRQAVRILADRKKYDTLFTESE